MNPETRVAYDGQRDFSRKAFRSGCYAPFVSMYFTTLGDVLACCKNEAYVLGNISQLRLAEIWKGRKIADLRIGLKQYQFEGGCEFCGWQLAEGNYKGVFAANFESFPLQSEEPEWPQEIEFAGSNNCNFECIMCCGDLSSSIRAHREGLPPLPRVYSDQFFDDLRPFLPHLRQAKFLGGEPFLAQECFRIWDMMLEDGLKTPCHVTTNASQYNAKVERILEALPISVSISVDGSTKETVERIRVNSDYHEFIRNLHRFRQYTRRRRTWMGISHCLMRANWQEFGDVLLLAESLECPVFVNTVLSPQQLSLYTLPPEELDRIVDEMELQGRRLKGRLPINQQVWDNQLNNLRSNARGRQSAGLTQIQDTARTLGRTTGQKDPSSTSYSTSDGWALINAGRLSEALEQALTVQPSHPHYYKALVLRAHIHRLMGDLEQAEASVNLAVKLSRRPAEALLQRAWLRLKQDRLEEGVQAALEALELSGTNIALRVNIHRALGYLYLYMRDLEGTRNALDRLVELSPNDADLRVQRAQAFEAFGLFQEALQEADAALALDPTHAGAIECRDRLRSRGLCVS